MDTIWMHDALPLALGWLGYFLLHSLLAADRLKRAFKSVWPRLASGYRLAYNGLAILLLLPLVWLTLSSDEFLVSRGTTLTAAAFLFLAMSAFVLISTVREMDLPEFLGTRPEGHSKGSGLMTGGIYAYVRHPLYFGTFLLFAGLLAWWPTVGMIVTSTVVWVYLVIGSRLEERKLIRRFGSEYLVYRSRVKGLIPYVF